ncbi:hypothetical protein SUGI_0230490 [Cryptomeria japonica]|uniref:uncharacterized protein LOC131076019 n=1 Tax=Cryptomeria japonica TaxID=3369 RepID=UPI002408D3FC|nr:uncharacterized protein LOC131076019 [Cryptomeria japonica]GLJ14310.1 hypothetical protein SUGI_0230490 [Cryptomeria japonica]
MASEAANRRIHQIACHLIANTEAGGDGVFASSCKGTMNSVIKRYDNMVLFARQGTASQGFFMRQVTTEQFPDHDVRAASSSVELSSTPDKKTFASKSSQGPMFSKPVEFWQGSPASRPIFSKPVEFWQGSPASHEVSQQQLADRSPMFSKPASSCTKSEQTTSAESHLTVQVPNNLNEWSPRMDAVESGSAYVVTVELPGVTASGIRVEVDDKRLSVTGKRSTEWWRDGNNKYAVYHKRELSEGPYCVTWQFPSNSNRDAVSAEFVDGLLQIRIPKNDQ